MAEKKELAKCTKHMFVITNWLTRGGHQKATEARCMHCLKQICLESVAIKEWQNKEGINVES